MTKIKYMSLLEHFTLEDLLDNIKVKEHDTILKNAIYFNEDELHRKDQILESYLSNKGLEVVSRTVTEVFARVPDYANILDVGAGTGFFTYRVSELMTAFYRKKARFWAFDISREMLLAVCRREAISEIIPIQGHAEKIRESILFHKPRYDKQGIAMPLKYNGIMSVLALHHCVNPENVFLSMNSVLMEKGSIVIIDECKHTFEEHRDEMLDVHPGFDLDELKRIASTIFPKVTINKLAGVICDYSGKKAEIFALIATKN